MRRMLVFLSTAVLVACGASDDDTLQTLRDREAVRVASRGNVTVELEPQAPIRLGKNDVAVRFPVQEGVELSSATAIMPAHGHGSAPPTIERAENGFVMRGVVFYMSGRWELHLGLRVDTRDDSVIVAVDVP